MSAMTKKEWMEYLGKTWDAAQKEAWSEPEFECPRCGHCCQSGMSLRDYFAGKAMQALAQGNYFDATARQAYMIADAMLKARER
jgi:hypothetical protein